jgi:hypothetical protein
MLTLAGGGHAQVDTPWRKAQTRVEGEDEYEQLDKLDQLAVFEEYIRCLPHHFRV